MTRFDSGRDASGQGFAETIHTPTEFVECATELQLNILSKFNTDNIGVFGLLKSKPTIRNWV